MASTTFQDTPPASGSPGHRPEIEAPRPPSDIWRQLRDEGIQWEGQVLLAGAKIDLPALVILTGERLAIVSDGSIALDVPRHWLTPEPRLGLENDVRVWITPAGQSTPREETTALLMRVRGGRGSAARLVGAITGRLVTTRSQRPIPAAADQHEWQSGVGASTSVALPPLPANDADRPAPRRPWPPVEHHAVAPPPVPTTRPRREAEAPLPAQSGAATGSWPTPAPSTPPVTSGGADRAFPPDAAPPRRTRRWLGWSVRTLVLALLIGGAIAYSRDYLPHNLNIPLPARLEQRLGWNTNQASMDVAQATNDGAANPTEPPAQNSDGTSGAANSDLIGSRSGDQTGVGGMTGDIPSVGNGMLDEPPATDEPTAIPTEIPATDEPTVIPTEIPATDEPTVIPTEIPATDEPTVIPTDAPATDEPTVIPTDAPATDEPTAIPTDAPTATGEPTAIPTDAPATGEPTATLESQDPTVNPAGKTQQSMASGAFRYTVAGGARGTTIAGIPDLQSVGGYGEWVVLSVYGQNTSDTEQVFDMSTFRIVADGREFLLDVGNAWVGGLLGYTPAYGNADSILWASGEGHEFALTFLVPTGAESLQLIAGDQVLDLTSVLADDARVAGESTPPAAPTAIEATVVDVIDAETIVIEKDGIRQTVRYLGIDVPTGDVCFASEAAAANAAIVAGQTVRIERQATDLDARGNWVRDVWAPTSDGSWGLVSQILVREGMATAAPSAPNLRFADWLIGAQELAQQEEAGLWGACDAATASETGGPISQATLPIWRSNR